MENTADIMKRLGLKYGNFDEMEKIRIYLEYHPEVFTEDFMELLADRYLNYLTVRKRIKEMWPELCRQNINNFNIIPNDYEKIKEKVFKNRKP
ncbi:hypothetical protein [Prevotella sp. P6B4]|jgi:hypothetical protein|uniref:hypothetical protein n=1 Tax=Prevotella sp. P6B4 TaxID=1410614 RepID=UPI00048AD577|nr:hypothetical protein [Prevotella sp. P6B4]